MSNEYLTCAAQAMGMLAFPVSLIGYLSTNDRRLKIMMTVGAAILSLHFVLFGAWIAAVSLVLNTARSWLSVHRRGLRWFIPVAIAQLVISVPLIHGARDTLPIIGSMIGSYGLLCLSGIKLRLAMLITTFFWLANNMILGSVGAVLLDCLNASAHVFAMLRLHRLARQKPA